MEKEAKQSRSVNHKSFLIILKYMPYTIALIYFISTFLAYFDYELIQLGYIGHLAIIPWAYMILSSVVFRFCYIHRLPLYYVIVNDVLNIIDCYIGIPINASRLFQLHLIVVFVFISLYTYGYIKVNKKYTRIDNS